jgi:PAS domain-containing protein
VKCWDLAWGAIATTTNPPEILAVESTLPRSPSELQTTLQNAASLYQQTITQAQTLAIAQAKPEYSAYLGTPLWVNGSPYGTLNFSPQKTVSPDFNAHENEIIELMAQSLGKYIETRQREELRQQAEVETQLLLRVTQAIGEAPDFTTALQVALTQVATSCGWHYGEAWIPSVDGQYLECASAWYGIPDSGTAQTPLIQELREFSVQLHFKSGQGLPGRVWAKAKPEYLDAAALKADGDFKRRAWIKNLGIQNALSVPIMRHQAPTDEWQQQNRVLAVLVFLMFDLPPYQHIADNERLAALVTAVATQLGTAIQQKQDRDVLRALFAAMDDWVTVWDRHGRCIQVAPTHHSLPSQWGDTQPPLTAWIGKTLDEIFPPETVAVLHDRIAQTLSCQEGTQLEYCLEVNQQQVWFDARLSPLSPETILLTARDISDRKLIEQKLRTNEAELRGVFEAMSDIVLAIHPAEQSVRVMPTCYTHLDAQAHEILNLTLNYLFNCEEHPEFLQAIQTAIATQKTIHFEYHLQLANRLVWFDASISPITADAAIWVARDISDRAALQASLQQLTAELEQRVEQRTAQLREANHILQSEVSDRLQAQKELARSTEQLQAVLDAVPGFVFWVGQGDRPNSRYAPNLRYLGVNHRFAKAFNLNTDAFINQPLGFIGQDVPLTQPIEQFLYSSTAAIAKTIELNLNRETRSYLLVAQKYHQNNAAVAIAVDITPRIQAEQQAKQAYQRLELLSELTLKIRRSLDLDEILNTAMFEVKKLFDTERVALIQIETCYRYEIVKETLNAEIDSLECLRPTTPFPDPQAWESFNGGQCLTLTAALATRNSNMRSRLQQLGIYAELLVPILSGKTCGGQ